MAEWWDIKEIEWLESTDYSKLIYFLAHRGGASARKCRLFAVSCCQFIQPLMHDHRSQNAVDVVERVADGNAGPDELETAHRLASEAHENSNPDRKMYPPEEVARLITMPNEQPSSLASTVAARVASVVGEQAWKEAMGTNRRYQDKMMRTAWERQGHIYLSLLRCIFGNPFRPANANSRWLTPTVVAVAQGVYEDRAFDRLPILADALEESGCTDASILDHCRATTPHVRGCWVVDLLLKKS